MALRTLLETAILLRPEGWASSAGVVWTSEKRGCHFGQIPTLTRGQSHGRDLHLDLQQHITRRTHGMDLTPEEISSSIEPRESPPILTPDQQIGVARGKCHARFQAPDHHWINATHAPEEERP